MGAPDFSEISWFELDKLFTQSAKSLRRRQQRRRRREKENNDDGQHSPSRSRTPPRRLLGRFSQRGQGIPQGGFTGPVDKVEKTVVVTQVPQAADEMAVFKHFSKCGTVNDVRLVRTKGDAFIGICIVEFIEDEAVLRACTLASPHSELLGSALVVKRADAQLNRSTPAPKRMMTRQQFTQQVLSGLKTGGVSGESSGPNMRKLHIKNLRPVVTEEDMRGIFKPFGEFESFEMGSQECWITFQTHSDAQDATTSMQGFQLVGQEIQIEIQAVPQPKAPEPLPQKIVPKLDILGDSDFGATGAGVTNMHNRIELMKKLLTSHSQQGVPTVVGLAAPGAPSQPAQAAQATLSAMPPTPKPGTALSRTLLLQNMFTPTAVNLKKDPKFYEEIREDTHDECTKFGKVLHVTVDPRGTTGLIYVLYESPQQRSAAEMALNGRWFEGKKIVAMGIDDSIWRDLASQAQAGGAVPA